MPVPRDILKRAKKIKLLAMDIDGVLTDGAIVVLDSGEEVKSWHVRDRIGFFMLKRLSRGFRTAWITGRRSKQVKTRAREIGVDALFQQSEDKGADLKSVMSRFGISPEQALFIGDDLVDLPALRLAGLAVCPADAHPLVRRACRWVTKAAGGEGVFREVVDAVLESQGLMDRVVKDFERPG